jgi:hypothetical protein
VKYATRHICIVAGIIFGALLMTHNAGTGTASTTVFSSSIAMAARSPAQNCPQSVSSPEYWNSLVGAHQGASHIEHIVCKKLQGNTTRQALITVRHNGNAAQLDVYVYTHINSHHHELLFSAQGLVKGDATISGYNTLLIGEADRHAMLNEGQTDQQLTQDLYREFRWSAAKQRFVQITFPGMFPDMTRYQAEIDQQRVNYGLDRWKSNAATVAAAAAKQFFSWKRPTITSIIRGGSIRDVAATIRVTQLPTPGNTIAESTVVMQLSRLEGKHANIWEVTRITSSGTLRLTAPKDGSKATNPVHIAGSGDPSFEGIVGMAFVLDHLGLEIGHARATGKGNIFQAEVKYTSTVSDPVHEEGIVAVFSFSEADGSVSTAVMEKVIL